MLAQTLIEIHQLSPAQTICNYLAPAARNIVNFTSFKIAIKSRLTGCIAALVRRGPLPQME